MKAVVLAAGKGTRIRPLSETVPKPMLPVGDRPLAAHAVDAAIDAGADEIVLVVGYEADPVREFFGSERGGVPVSYAVQSEQNGTADAVNVARSHLEGPFAVLNGDNLYDPAAIERLFEQRPAVCAIEVDDPASYGVLSTDDGTVSRIVEKPTEPSTNLANAGAYAFPAKAVEWLDVSASERGEHEITDVLARVIEEFAVTPVTLERWMDVGRPWELLEANELKLDELDRRVDGDVSGSAHLEGNVVVESGATVKPGAVIEGPVLIRSGATVGPNAYVRGATLLGEDVSVGNAVEIKNSVLLAGTSVSHLSYVGDSVLGRNVNFGAGTTVANLRHDDADVKYTVKGDRISTGRRKFGVVVGDGVKTGINSSLTPGLRLENEATTDPGEVVERDR
ncbi:bifunctional sugar-1-phosphate nucleotidylyltransferase/acetyltransferase [Natronobacterium gregoryi]|uniref:Bifunctional protein GlmU n=2 Tax=Natronobacterium gregoryi TaxID=44930 RepID=L0ALX4_NATGS|nr:bifunctional sugar-1-phosphate nucleotidylyltransferase/acetyltransferase [Natronobacterium gregoryi]AFZ74459.1 UDP-N-acetylglucosamine diphosphorylase/glucosamine-1-phosphate N-acetyltransferase [Natronobacterium gregoryi SP2]ELY72243.1 glucosamine-1-phosphate N-acetyltransferase [Natronobacterium gregoryi SP2]PLK21792.1 glucose-1-phosphate thymidylyltransferase [Natronobacterium gregoryi SP2]SFJ46206.1 bifunctional UDP-N-acetylglucosamine pyrophosphorylase / Glucosamine-1-phosphate N-acety